MLNSASRGKLQEDLRTKRLMASLQGSTANKTSGGIQIDLKLPEEDPKKLEEHTNLLTQIAKSCAEFAKPFEGLIQEAINKLVTKTFLVYGKVHIVSQPPLSLNSSDLMLIRSEISKLNESIQKINVQPVVNIPEQKSNTKELQALISKLDNLKVEVPESKNEDFSSALEGVEKQLKQLVEMEANRVSYRPTPVTNVSINALRGIIKTTPVNVLTLAQLIVPANLSNRRAIKFYNSSATETVYWGGSDVTTANGIPVGPGAHSDPLDAGDNMDVYVVAANTTEIRVVEISNSAVGK